ncbi:MAG: ATP-binding protein [Pirellulaceae bacterium]|nr:ATP-binding protein [Pirellulaceae bacterium]
MADTAWEWSLHEHIPSSSVSGHELIERYIRVLEQFGWDGRDLFHVQLAVEEAIVNAITHGNHESPDKTVEVELHVSRLATSMRIQDQGAGFCPDALPDPTEDENLESPHGRGVMLIKQMMDKVDYNARGNQVTMLKRRSESAG